MNGSKQALWRKNQVLELSSKGLTQSDIAKILQISISTISRDLYFLREQAKDNLKIVSVSRKK
jgi:transcriptional regulator